MWEFGLRHLEMPAGLSIGLGLFSQNLELGHTEGRGLAQGLTDI